MGVLCNEMTGIRAFLRPEHAIGRNLSRVDTYLAAPEVSSLHCLLRWQCHGWQIQDISRNGTFINGRQLPKGQWVPLQLDQLIRFGSPYSVPWRFSDDTQPCTCLIADDQSAAFIPLSNSNLLPPDQNPEISIFQSEEGHWVLETQQESRRLQQGETLSVAGQQYRLLIVERIDDTQIMADTSAIVPLQFRFNLSQDEEHTQLRLMHGNQVYDMGERQHHYSLTTLARKRFADAQAGYSASEQGWLDCGDLAQMLGIDPQYLNIQIFRARNQLMTQLPQLPQLAHIVERRRGSLRLGNFAFEIHRGAQIEAEYQPAVEHPLPTATA